ncbi:matrix Gla protein-like [Chelydra serpentina]|uniref:Matrix Gla protein-like n=1 Tax=Chelydra serpentina TaxID=8475 RepID=A0A8T1SCX6_CHESE|nr:matrix Gla protein-like [Chelydra serpentina]
MRKLLVLLLLTLALAAFCYCERDSKDSLESHGVEGVKVKRETANAFVRRQKRSYPYYERYYEMYKSPMELRKEQCENYAPCDYLSEHVGFYAAYQRYFGRF